MRQLDRNLEQLVNRRFRQYMWKKGHSVSAAWAWVGGSGGAVAVVCCWAAAVSQCLSLQLCFEGGPTQFAWLRILLPAHARLVQTVLSSSCSCQPSGD